MEINWKKYIFSSILATTFLFNVAYLPTFAYCADGGYAVDEPCHCHMKKRMDAMFTEIGINCQQKQQIDCIIQASKEKEDTLRKCKHEKKQALWQYMMTSQATKEQALCMENEISELHKQLHELRINTFFDIKNILTPCQQQKMHEYHQKHKAEFKKRHKKHSCRIK